MIACEVAKVVIHTDGVGTHARSFSAIFLREFTKPVSREDRDPAPRSGD
jgi:hypothetical protein